MNPNHSMWDGTGDGGVRSANRATALGAKFSVDRRKLENKFEAVNQTSTFTISLDTEKGNFHPYEPGFAVLQS